MFLESNFSVLLNAKGGPTYDIDLWNDQTDMVCIMLCFLQLQPW